VLNNFKLMLEERRSLPYLGTLAILLALAEISIDAATWIQLNIAIIYGLPLVLAAATRSRRLIWVLTLVLVCATFLVYALQIPPGVFTPREPMFVDRVLAAITLVLTAGLLHALSLATDALEVRGKELDHQRMEAEEASERKTRLLMSVSHDIRTPLTTIQLMADLITDSATKPDLLAKVPGLTRNLQASASSLADMVTDVLDVSSFDSGRISAREADFSVNDLISEECRALELLAAAQKLALKTNLAQPAIWIRADRVKLGRVLRNLVKNAIQFTRQGEITVTSSLASDGSVLVRVIDTGVGIARENLERVFGEFMQLRSPQSADNQGWGLGLAICRRLMRLMEGEITIESEPGRGSIFTVRLPASRVLQQGGN
jgi:signal transduction histidine kinase